MLVITAVKEHEAKKLKITGELIQAKRDQLITKTMREQEGDRPTEIH